MCLQSITIKAENARSTNKTNGCRIPAKNKLLRVFDALQRQRECGFCALRAKGADPGALLFLQNANHALFTKRIAPFAFVIPRRSSAWRLSLSSFIFERQHASGRFRNGNACTALFIFFS